MQLRGHMDLRLTSTKAGRFLTIPNDVYVGKSIEVYGEWSYGEIEALKPFLGAGDNVLEVGSNIGAHTVFIARDLCPDGQVYAFEPRRILFQILCANLMLNNISNVSTFQMALGDEEKAFTEGELPIEQKLNAGAFALGSLLGTGEEIKVARADQYIDSMKRISVLKADVEGHEYNVVSGAMSLINRDRPVLYLENDRVDKSEDLLGLVKNLNYNIYWHVVPLFRGSNFAMTRANIFANISSFNILCIPQERALTIRGLRQITNIRDHPLKKNVDPAI